MSECQVLDMFTGEQRAARGKGKRGTPPPPPQTAAPKDIVSALLSGGDDPNRLAVPNGTVDLRTGELRPATTDAVARCAVAYRPGADCALWEQSFNEIFGPDADVIEFARRAVGGTVVGAAREQVFFVLYGAGANGTSTFVNTLAAVLGPLAWAAAPETFTAGRDRHRAMHLAELAGRRFLTVPMLDGGAELAPERVAAVAHGDQINARFLYSDPFTFEPRATLWLTANELPTVTDAGDSFWRSARVVPLRRRFLGADTAEIIEPADGEEVLARDLERGARLREELPGILAWAVRAARDYLADGLGLPGAVLDATRTWRKDMTRRAGADGMGLWIGTRVAVEPGAETKSNTLYQRYTRWCKRNEFEPQSRAKLGKALARWYRKETGEDLVRKQKRNGARRDYHHVGITLKREKT